MKKILSLAIALVLVLALGACSNKNDNDVQTYTNADGSTVTVTTITVSFAECGFGSEYLTEWEKAYNIAHPTEQIKLDLDGDSQMTQNIGTRITTGKNVPDLVMVLSTNWQVWAASGMLAEIDDVYEADAGLGDGTKMKDFICDNLSTFGKVDDHYYAVPWSCGPTGFIYNETMFEDYGWKVPTTTSELEALCEQIVSDTAGTVQPFAWSTGTAEYWSFVTLNWWAEIDGVEGWNTFWDFESPEVYRSAGRLACLKEFETLICNNGTTKNSVTNSKFMLSQADFINGKAAMIPNGIWFETEMKSSTPDGFRMKMMATPVIDGATETNVNVNSSGDFIVIPVGAEHIEAAKKFLEFINTKEGCEIFTKYAGGIRPFKYEPSKVEGISDFMKSICEMWENETNLFQTSDNYMYYNNDLGLWPVYGSPYNRMVQDEDSAETVINSIYNSVVTNWSAYQNHAFGK